MAKHKSGTVNLDWEFSGHQLEFMNSLSGEVMLSGSFGSGKTRAICMKGVLLSLMYPGNRGLLVRKFYNTMATSTLWTLLRPKGDLPPVLPPELIIDHHKTNHIIEIDTGVPGKPSYIFYSGLDDPAKLGSFADVGWIGIDEGTETSEDDWSQLSGRLRHNVPFHQLFTATNPDSPQHYLYRKFYDRYDMPRKDKNVHCIESNSLMNKWLPPAYIERLNRLTGVYYDRFVLGKWVAFVGQIYDIWNKDEHVIPAFDIPGDWGRIISIDFGFTNPSVVQWWAIAPKDYDYVGTDGVRRMVPSGGMVLYREIYKTRVLNNDLADWVKKETGSEKVVATVTDWDAQGREAFTNAGIVVQPALKSVETGIQSAYSRMRLEHSIEIPTPRLLVFENSLCHAPDDALYEAKRPTRTQEEIPLYRRHTLEGAGVGGANRVELPIKKDDHGCDAMRYAAMAVDNIDAYEPMVIKMRVVG